MKYMHSREPVTVITVQADNLSSTLTALGIVEVELLEVFDGQKHVSSVVLLTIYHPEYFARLSGLEGQA